ncbi:LOW QUALITY PROTEIN: hypothetical protein HID58_037298 [Brassica napus]|uniref:DRBM domain-containing protein n=1 Tax=Brassica napus TaxID=3708 RepID=A0ABQ8BKW4_BRANA|nr:LOW QUALITY PROTEIN: hypothetical protein HID58_037298 [Brassica napus]
MSRSSRPGLNIATHIPAFVIRSGLYYRRENVFLCCFWCSISRSPRYFLRSPPLSVVVSRLLCFWDSRNINKNGEFMGSTILFLDEKMNRHEFLDLECKIIITKNPYVCNYIYLNSTPGTKFYFDTTIPAIEAFTESLGGAAGEVFTRKPMRGIRKKELVTIGDLHTYLSNSNAQSQEADFLYKARIVGVLQQNGWTYVSCTVRNRKTRPCPKVNSRLFRVELAVEDGKDNANVCEMSKLTKTEAATLALEKVWALR